MQVHCDDLPRKVWSYCDNGEVELAAVGSASWLSQHNLPIAPEDVTLSTLGPLGCSAELCYSAPHAPAAGVAGAMAAVAVTDGAKRAGMRAAAVMASGGDGCHGAAGHALPRGPAERDTGDAAAAAAAAAASVDVHTIRARYVICTLPVGVLRASIGLGPRGGVDDAVRVDVENTPRSTLQHSILQVLCGHKAKA